MSTRPSPNVLISVSPTPEQFEVIKGKSFTVNFHVGRSKKLREGSFIIPEFGRSELGVREGWIWTNNYEGCSMGATVHLTIVKQVPEPGRIGSPIVKKRMKSAAAGINLVGKVTNGLPRTEERAPWPFPVPLAEKIATKPVVKKSSVKPDQSSTAKNKVAKEVVKKPVAAKKVVKKKTATKKQSAK